MAGEALLTCGGLGSELGEFRLPYGIWPVEESASFYVADTLNHRVQRMDVVIDNDMDGIDDTYEALNGLDNTDPTDALMDPDGDGVLTIGEYRIGLDPHDPDTDNDDVSDGGELWAVTNPFDPEFNNLRITKTLCNPVSVVRWMAESGKVYRIQRNVDITGGAAWEDLIGSNLMSPSNGVSFWEINPVETNNPVYYRVIEVNP